MDTNLVLKNEVETIDELDNQNFEVTNNAAPKDISFFDTGDSLNLYLKEIALLPLLTKED